MVTTEEFIPQGGTRCPSASELNGNSILAAVAGSSGCCMLIPGVTLNSGSIQADPQDPSDRGLLLKMATGVLPGSQWLQRCCALCGMRVVGRVILVQEGRWCVARLAGETE